ncbi:myotubularin-like [Bolinopsis microptera]|uniref:myotubularin-like n=1 Tax=Bolinopsis microptera TaxID=2820187 RepID=UPI00307A6C77
MDALRLRIRYHHYNTTLSAPSHSLLKQISVEKRAGFTRYNLDKEHNRQGDMRGWTKVDNTNYRQCKSYPPLFYVPVQAGSSLVSVIMFRSKGRIPALSWLNNSGAILMRSAQPRTGILQKNCKEDELFLESVQTLSRNKSGKDLPFMIFDARSKIAARGNQMKGKGMENVANYENTKLNFLDMANIHAIRDSFEKVTAMCNAPSNTKWETRLEQSQWLLHVQSVVRGAYFVSQHLVAGGAALVHCSDGWDRTSQLTSLSLLLVDPYYRTYSGFQVLVEREWLSFGHRFHDRLGMAHPSQKSPIFLLFLDAVHQFLVQFPDVFEFTQEYLTVLCDLFSSGWTTTFLRNCPQERSSADRLQLWDVLDAMRTELTNERYYLSTDPINPRVSLRHMVLWREYFLRFDWWRETLAEDRQGPVVWVPDHAVQNCHLCHERFNALKFKRKHHCRSCGNIFCGNCASKRICIPLKNYTTPVLVCDKCYQEHTTSP